MPGAQCRPLAASAVAPGPCCASCMHSCIALLGAAGRNNRSAPLAREARDRRAGPEGGGAGRLEASRARPEIRRGISRAIEEISVRPATRIDCAFYVGISTCSAAIFPRPGGNGGLGRLFRWRLWSAKHALDADTRTAGTGRTEPVGRSAFGRRPLCCQVPRPEFGHLLTYAGTGRAAGTDWLQPLSFDLPWRRGRAKAAFHCCCA